MNTKVTSAVLPEMKQARTYLLAGMFVAGNVVLPQLVHLIPGGGPMLLPIYFFTLIAAWRYGLATGLMTALLSPVINHLLFGMPALAILPVLLTKSALLATAAAVISHRVQGKASLMLMLITVLAYQIPGTLAEYLFTGSWQLALQDFRVGIPGMLVQIILGTVVVRKLTN